MKKIVSVLLVVVLVVSSGMLIGCGKKDDAKKEAATKAKEAVTNAKEVASKAAKKKEDVSKAADSNKEKATKELSSEEKALEEASKAMSKKPPKRPTVHGSGIPGVWEYNQKDYNIPAIYTFKKGGTGTYELAGQLQKLTWKTKGKKIYININNQGEMEQKYKLKDDVLTLYDITNKPVEYYRVG